MNFSTKSVELQQIQLNWEITQSQEAEREVERYILSSGSAKKDNLVRIKYHGNLFSRQSLIFTFLTKMKKRLKRGTFHNS